MDRNRHIDIMGIVNVTDDSFYSSSRCRDAGAAIERIAAMAAEGADIIDLGACSSRPGSSGVGPDEEWRRLEPVLREFRKEFPGLKLSVDTYWSDVVRRTYDLVGDFIVNDISAGEDDPGMLPAVAEMGLVYVAMHKKGGPADMQSKAVYDNVTEEVAEYFNKFSVKAYEAGIKEWILDPGFGFAKTIEQNYQLLNEMRRLKSVAGPGGRPPRILAGLSRKSMAYRFLGIGPEDSLPATQVLHVAALRNGADILRVHDVAEALRTVTLYRALDL